MPTAPRDVRCRGQPGKHLLRLGSSQRDPADFGVSARPDPLRSIEFSLQLLGKAQPTDHYRASTYRMMLWFWTFATNSSARDRIRRSRGEEFAALYPRV